MKRLNDRRTAEGYKLRVYMDALKDVRSMTNEVWLNQWVANAAADTDWISRDQWMNYLTTCILVETEKMLYKEAA